MSQDWRRTCACPTPPEKTLYKFLHTCGMIFILLAELKQMLGQHKIDFSALTTSLIIADPVT